MSRFSLSSEIVISGRAGYRSQCVFGWSVSGRDLIIGRELSNESEVTELFLSGSVDRNEPDASRLQAPLGGPVSRFHTSELDVS